MVIQVFNFYLLKLKLNNIPTGTHTTVNSNSGSATYLSYDLRQLPDLSELSFHLKNETLIHLWINVIMYK